MYKSKFTGQEIDNNIEKINNLNVDEINTQITDLQNQNQSQQTQITDLQNNKIEKTDGVITSNLIANDSIITSKIPDNTITSAKIVKHQVTDDKLTITTLNKINKSLQTPTTAPTATELVGIDTNNAQVNIGIGEGLSLENGNLKATGGASGGITQKILWTNPNPNVSFAEQDININDDLNDYNLLLFTQKISSSDKNYFTGFTDIANFKTLGSLMLHAEYYNKWGRGYNYINETTIHASAGQYNAEGNNNYGIPINIIGYKF